MKPYYDEDGITIYCGDCREILPNLEDESIDMIFTDPPYGHRNNDNDLQSSLRVGVKGARQNNAMPIRNDDEKSTREVIDCALIEAVRILKRDCCCCYCCAGGGGPRPSFAWTASRMDDKGLSFFQAVVWDKSARGNGLGWRYRRNYEFVMIAHRIGGKLLWANDNITTPNIVRDTPVIERQHPNEKPIPLVARFLRLHASVGQIVLDPFMGSGTTLRAARDLGLRAIGIEIEERYCEIAVRRLQQQVLNFGEAK